MTPNLTTRINDTSTAVVTPEGQHKMSADGDSQSFSSSSSDHHHHQQQHVCNGQVKKPGINDVLCGRGGSINSHPGNENFRRLVEKRKRVYLTARFKREKRLIASSIVQEIRKMDPPGRFLAKKGDKGDAHWYDIGDEKARDKTSQALRENAPTIRLEIETEINEQRREMSRKESAMAIREHHRRHHPHHPHAQSAVPGASSHHGHPHGHPPPPPSHYQSYWEHYYNYYYGGHPGASAPPPPSSHQHPHHPPHPYPPPPVYGWGHARVHPHPVQSSPDVQHQTDDSAVSVSASASAKAQVKQELHGDDADFRYAAELQRQENMAAFQSRRRGLGHGSGPDQHKLKSDLSVSTKTARVSHGQPQYPTPGQAQHQQNRLYQQEQGQWDPTSPHGFRMMQPDRHHPASASPTPVNATVTAPMSPCKTQRQLDQEQKDHRIAVALQEQEDSFALQHVEASLNTSRRTSRSNAFSQVNRLNRDAFVGMMQQGQVEQPPPATDAARDEASQKHRQGLPAADDNSSSLLTQLGNQLMGTLGSWDPTGRIAQLDESVGSKSNGGNMPGAGHSPAPSIANSFSHHSMGHGQQAPDARESSPPPRVEIDWPSRVGSCHSWLPDTFGASNLFGFTNPRHPSGGPPGGFQSIGISPVNSLEMDVSGTGNSQGSVGGGSLCQVFDPPVDKMLMNMMPQEDANMMPSPRALQQIPSWERSMRSHRSKSPINMTASMEEEERYHLRMEPNKPRRLAQPPEGTILPLPRSVEHSIDHHSQQFHQQQNDDYQYQQPEPVHQYPPPRQPVPDSMEWE